MTIVADGLLGLAWLGFVVVSLGRLILEGAVGLIATVELLRSQPFKLKAQIAAKPRPFILLSIIKLVAKTPTLDAIINCLKVLLT